jgi:8-oxo-dGTP pyrophosphatase MutT (NUDIX family)
MTTDGKQAVEHEPDEEIARIEAMINSGPMQRMRLANRTSGCSVKPKNAASIILVSGEPGHERIVMGKRNKNLKFMPGALVFPGGRVDAHDRKVVACDQLESLTQAKLVTHMRGNTGPRDAHGLGIAAIRELAEETGLLIGEPHKIPLQHRDWQGFAERNIAPKIGSLRLLARAITPPGIPRRFDTFFFVMRSDGRHFSPQGGFAPSGELEELQWITPQDAMRHETREITRVILVELMNRLRDDPDLDPATPAPCYVTRGDRFIRTLM